MVYRRHVVARQPFGARMGQKRVPDEPAHHAPGLSRGGIFTKVHLVTDGAGLPVTFTLTNESGEIQATRFKDR